MVERELLFRLSFSHRLCQAHWEPAQLLKKANFETEKANFVV